MTEASLNAAQAPRWLLTGAAGQLGRQLRTRLQPHCATLRLSDREPLADAGAGEEGVMADLADALAGERAVAGVDAIVHLGGVSTEQPWAPILQANIVGAYHLYEAARRHRVARIVFASSNHVTGFYRQDEVITARDPVRPDGLYGLSKAFGENLAQLYWDRYGIETVSVRIGSSFPEPMDRRMLASWLSFDDLARLVLAALTAPRVAHSVIYGMSANPRCWWDNRYARHVGYEPHDSSEPFRAAVEARQAPLPRTDPRTEYQGGAFVAMGPHGPPWP